MRRKLLVAALLATTALTPTRAAADPITGFIAALFSASGAGIFGATVSLAAAFTGGGILAIAGRVILGIGLSYLAQQLAPKPKVPPPQERMGNWAQPIAYAETVYGMVRKGGPIGFIGKSKATDSTTGIAGSKHYRSIIMASHECDEYLAHYLDDEEVTINSSTGLVTSGDRSGYYRINPLLGASGQVADQGLLDAFPAVTASHDFAGLAVAHMFVKKPADEDYNDVLPTGAPAVYSAVIKGHNGIYDPRTGTTGYTDNAALVIAHWITNKLKRSVDWSKVATQADISDVTITTKDSLVIPTWVLSGTLDDGQDFETQRSQLGAACDAFFMTMPDGTIDFMVGGYVAPEVFLTGDNIISLEETQFSFSSDAPTRVSCLYTDPANQYYETLSGSTSEETGVVSVEEHPQLYFIRNHNQAWRMNERIKAVRRPESSIRGTITLAAGKEIMNADNKRFINVAYSPAAVSGEYEISLLWLNEGGLTFGFEATKIDKASMQTDPADEPDRPDYKSAAGVDIVEAVAGLRGEVWDTSSIRWTWEVDDSTLAYYLQWRASGDTIWNVETISAGTGTVLITGLVSGTTYEAQAAVKSVGYYSPATPIHIKLATGTTAPVALTAFSGVASGSDIVLSATSSGSDANFDGTRFYRSDTVYGTRRLVHTEYSAAGATITWTDVNPGAGTWYYWAYPINSSGVEGPVSGSISVTV